MITEQNPGYSDGQVTNSDGYIKIHVSVTPASPANIYTVDYAYYMHANDTRPTRSATNYQMTGVQFDLGSFFNEIETTGTLTLNKTVLGLPAEDANDSYTFYVNSGDTYYGMNAAGELIVSSNPIECNVHPGVPFVLRNLPLDRTYSVTESRSSAEVEHYDVRVSGEGSVLLSSTGSHRGEVTITNSYTGLFETGSISLAKFGSDTNGTLLADATFTLTSDADMSDVTVSGASGVARGNGSIEFTTVSTEAVYFEGLTAGTYTITEVSAPDNYLPITDSVEFTVNRYGQVTYSSDVENVSYDSVSNVIRVTDEREEIIPVTATVDISKKDTVAGNEIEGASITITSNEGLDLSSCVVTGNDSAVISNSTISFVSTGSVTTVEGLPVGTYTMHEVAAPNGYQVATDIRFTVDTTGRITGSAVTAATADSNAVVTMLDGPSVVDISKVATGATSELPGAELEITAANASTVCFKNSLACS